MKIIVDAFGGDNAPLEIIKGSVDASKENGVEIILVGDEEKIRACATENGLDISAIEILHAPTVIAVDDDPTKVVKGMTDSSMSVGLVALTDGHGDAFVSAGSTGALVVGGNLIVRRIRGIKRAAIATVLPSNDSPVMLLDSGANLDLTTTSMVQFGLMGHIYMKRVLGVSKPRVALANIGVEETKGPQLYTESYQLMKAQSDYNFIGNIEARDIPMGAADVVVADGFTGNIILKMYEGVAGALMKNIKGIFLKNAITKIGALLVKNEVGAFKAKMDYKQYGGAPLLGLKKPVIKAHGSSDAVAIKNAIMQAKYFAETGVIADIEAYLSQGEDNND
jgi:glycerol-3-phosphate acyltransferase PlsX